MANYITIKGWLQCEYEQVETIRKNMQTCIKDCGLYAMNNEQVTCYSSAWVFPQKPLNWSAFIFFGADIKNYAVSFVKYQVESALINDEITGYFELEYEFEDLDKKTVWRIERKKIEENDVYSSQK